MVSGVGASRGLTLPVFTLTSKTSCPNLNLLSCSSKGVNLNLNVGSFTSKNLKISARESGLIKNRCCLTSKTKKSCLRRSLLSCSSCEAVGLKVNVGVLESKNFKTSGLGARFKKILFCLTSKTSWSSPLVILLKPLCCWKLKRVSKVKG